MIYNGTYTIKNKKTGEHRTFDITTQGNHEDFAPGKRIVSLLIGSNNESDYLKFGFVNDDNNRISVWKKFRSMSPRNEKSHYEIYALMIDDLCNGGAKYGSRYELLIEKKCIKCNRKLPTPDV
jgi:hypothetical protein